MNYLLIHIEFCRSTEDVAEDYMRLSDIEKEKIANVEVDITFDYEDEYDNYSSYLLISSVEYEKYKKILDDNLIPYICTDISKKVIYNEISLEEILIEKIDKYNDKSYLDFIMKTNSWIKENLNLDIVLDIINNKGLDSLREIDKQILKEI